MWKILILAFFLNVHHLVADDITESTSSTMKIGSLSTKTPTTDSPSTKAATKATSIEIALGQKCTEHDLCIGDNTMCEESFCTCKTDFYNKTGVCTRKIALGQKCTEHDPCSGDNTMCEETFCTCKTDFYKKTGVCTRKIALGQKCTEHDPCSGDNTMCDKTVCTCKTDFYNKTGVCTRKIALGQKCTEHDPCSGDNTMCDKTVCTCKTDFYNKTGVCTRKHSKNEPCIIDADCHRPFSCISNICTCQLGYYFTGESCDEKPKSPNIIGITSDDSSITLQLKVTPTNQNVNGIQVIYNAYNAFKQRNQSYTDEYIPNGKYTIRNLTAGTCYSLKAYSLINNTRSDQPRQNDGCTHPDEPHVSIADFNTTSISLTISKGKGTVQSYIINNNGKLWLKPPYANSVQTVVLKSTPGTFYQISVFAVYENLNSLTPFNVNCTTKPNVPTLRINGSTVTTTQISGVISQTKGGTEAFYLYSAEQFLNYTVTGANFLIFNLKPGKRYQIWATALFGNLTSERTNVTIFCTVPVPPDFQINNTLTTSKTISGYINQVDGGHDNFKLFCNGEKMSNVSIIGSDYTINNLDPGQRYHCTASSIFCDHKSANSSAAEECTVPVPPNFQIKNASSTTKTISGYIKQVVGGHEKFELYCNETKMLNVSINGSEYTVYNLKPGQSYTCTALTSFCHHKSASSKGIVVCTVPVPPHFQIKSTSTTPQTISGYINQVDGGHDQFELYCNGKKMTNVSIIGSDYTINNLDPGQRYNCTASTVYCGKKSDSSRKADECTVPLPPKFQINTTITTTKTISGIIDQEVGGHDNFELYCNGNKMSNLSISGSDYTINNLDPGKSYNCTVSTMFCGHKSSRSTTAYECTVPVPPNFQITNTTTTTKTISGNINQVVGAHDNFELYCNGIKMSNVSISGSNYTINNLDPGQSYNCTASTIYCGKTSTRSSKAGVCTVPNTPHFEVIQNSTTNNTISGKITPALGGKEDFKLYCQDVANLNYSIDGNSFKIRNLLPGQMLKCQASTIFCRHASANSTLVTEYTVPSIPRNAVVQKSSNETMELQITSGKRSAYIYEITLQPIGISSCGGNVVKRNGSNLIKINNLTAGTVYKISIISIFHEKRSSALVIQKATDPSPPSSIKVKKRNKDSVTIEIVKGKGCVKKFVVSVDGRIINVNVSQNKIKTVVTIPGLHSSTTYPIKVFAVSSSAFRTELASIQISLTTKKDPIPSAIGGIFGGIAALVVVLIVVLSWRRHVLCFKTNIQKEIEQGKMNAGFEEEVELEDNRRKRPITVSEFHRHVEMLSLNTNMGFSQEFKELGILSPKHSTDESQIQENRPKNRYTNILPFDHSLVKLIGIEDEIGSDFINANYIPGKRSKREFIATQGPLPSTKNEMWRMIWEQNVSIVVMLTQLIERGRKKCEIYWPENTNEKMFLGDIIVEVETLSHLSDYTLRTIALRLGDAERRIKHYNYIAWPDMGTPKTSSNMINFVDTVRNEIKPNMNGPIIVHCSAGVGRTGTFIVMDILMQEIRSKCTHVDIFGTVLNMRNYRLNMVQTEDQYVFIHNCVRDLLDVSDDEEEDRIEEQNAYLNEPIYQNVNE